MSGLTNGGAPHPSSFANYPLRKHKYTSDFDQSHTCHGLEDGTTRGVLIVEKEVGEIVREFVKESDTIHLYDTHPPLRYHSALQDNS